MQPPETSRKPAAKPRGACPSCSALEREVKTLRASQAELVAAAAALRESRRRLRDRALRDPLTGWMNRSGFTQRFRGLLTQAQRHGSPVGFLIIDIDRFKRINDQGGHAEGDRMLKACARRIRTALTESNAAGRYGGDEFLLVLPGLTQEQTRTLAERIRAAVSDRPFPLSSGTHRLTVSVGAAWMPMDQGPTLDGLLRMADQALYRAKRSGRNRSCFQG